MKAPSAILLSAILTITSLTTLAMPTFNVNVTNLPLDEQGNLKVTQRAQEPSWKTISIAENLNLSWKPSLYDWWVYSDSIDLGSINVSGYSRMKLYMEIANFTELYQGWPNEAKVKCSISSIYDYGEIYRAYSVISWRWDTTGRSRFTEFPSESMRETTEPSLRITLVGGSRTPNAPLLPSISCLVSIGLYLRNE